MAWCSGAEQPRTRHAGEWVNGVNKLPGDDHSKMAAMLAHGTSPAMVGSWVHDDIGRGDG